MISPSKSSITIFKKDLENFLVNMNNVFKRVIKKHLFGVHTVIQPLNLNQRYSNKYAKKLIVKHGLATQNNGSSITWYYQAYNRANKSHLVNYTLSFIKGELLNHVASGEKKAILVTGCGCGITSFHLEDIGFSVVGWDHNEKCINVANELKNTFKYDSIFRTIDCLNPTEEVIFDSEGKFDCVTVLYWYFAAFHEHNSTWGNSPLKNLRNLEKREQLLINLLKTYSRLLKSGGLLVVDLCDSVADYRSDIDSYLKDGAPDMYPVRYSPQSVDRCCKETGFEIIDFKFFMSIDPMPMTAYVLKKIG